MLLLWIQIASGGEHLAEQNALVPSEARTF